MKLSGRRQSKNVEDMRKKEDPRESSLAKFISGPDKPVTAKKVPPKKVDYSGAGSPSSVGAKGVVTMGKYKSSQDRIQEYVKKLKSKKK